MNDNLRSGVWKTGFTPQNLHQFWTDQTPEHKCCQWLGILKLNLYIEVIDLLWFTTFMVSGGWGIWRCWEYGTGSRWHDSHIGLVNLSASESLMWHGVDSRPLTQGTVADRHSCWTNRPSTYTCPSIWTPQSMFIIYVHYEGRQVWVDEYTFVKELSKLKWTWLDIEFQLWDCSFSKIQL